MLTVRRSPSLALLACFVTVVSSLSQTGCGGAARPSTSPHEASLSRGGGYVSVSPAPVSPSAPVPYVTTGESSKAGAGDVYSAPRAYTEAAPTAGSGGTSDAKAPSAAPAPYVTKGESPAPAKMPPPSSAGMPTAGKATSVAPAPYVTTTPAAATTITATGTVTIGSNPLPPPPPTPVVTQTVPQGGVLTASVLDDNGQSGDFSSFLARYPTFKETWGLDVGHRITIRVEDSNGVAVGDAPIALRSPDGSAVQLRAHADGTAYFYAPAAHAVVGNQQQQQPTLWAVAAQVGALRTESSFAMPQVDGTVTVRLPGVPARAAQPALDVALVVDCTGSMGDEITYLQAELAGVVTAVKSQQGTRRLRLGLVLYRDRGDDFITKTYDFTEDLPTFLNELKTASAQGGGDIPESVNAALSETVHRLSWAGDETGRLAILVGDAPPHYYADETWTFKNALPELSARGIKLVTVGASGVDKSTEYLFREMSAYTGGRYVWLTDDSGVGEAHTYADTPSYQVEHLDRLLIRVIGDEARAFKR
jgi:Mg-chelatase subunit ChlD